MGRLGRGLMLCAALVFFGTCGLRTLVVENDANDGSRAADAQRHKTVAAAAPAPAPLPTFECSLTNDGIRFDIFGPAEVPASIRTPAASLRLTAPRRARPACDLLSLAVPTFGPVDFGLLEPAGVPDLLSLLVDGLMLDFAATREHTDVLRLP